MDIKSRYVLIFASCLLAGVLFVIGSASAEPETAKPAVQAWEHMALTTKDGTVGGPETSRQINRAGDEGWELVDVTTIVRDGTTEHLVYCFKRPK